MTPIARSSLGINITSTRISMVLVRKDRKGLEVAKVAQAPVPDGMIANGRIVDVAGLTKLIKMLKTRHGLRAKHVAVSLSPEIVLVRLARLEENDPQRIKDAMAAEVKQYAALSGHKTTSDFRLITPPQGTTPGRALVAACDYEAVAELVRASNGAALPANIIEPAVLACLRICLPKPSGLPAGENVAVALLQDGSITTCLFRDGVPELIRTNSIGPNKADLDFVCRHIDAKTRAMLAFDQMDAGRRTQHWRVVLVDDGSGLSPGRVRDNLTEHIQDVTFDIVTQEDVSTLCGIRMPEQETVSLAALGAALRLLDTGEAITDVNLVPPEDPAKKRLQRATLVAGGACAFFMVLMLVVAQVFGLAIAKAEEGIAAAQESVARVAGITLGPASTELRAIEASAGLAAEETEFLRRIDSRASRVEWGRLLNEIRVAVPESLCITELFTREDGELIVEGLARSSAEVHAFADALRRSDCIQEARPTKIDRDDENPNLVNYTVRCVFGPSENR